MPLRTTPATSAADAAQALGLAAAWGTAGTPLHEPPWTDPPGIEPQDSSSTASGEAPPGRRTLSLITDGTAVVAVTATAAAPPDTRIDVATGTDGGTSDELVPTLLTSLAEATPDACWWVEGATDRHYAVAAAARLVPARTLLQMRVTIPLPAGDRSASVAPTFATRPYQPGADDEAWLHVNNRAFAWHPEQGGWTLDRLRTHLTEPWVDLEGIRVHESAGELDGFCWTRSHPASDEDPAMGEIHIVAADPSRHGSGLGRALTVAGLEHLAGRGMRWGMLYVESDNEPALRLYRRLGFTVHHSNVWFRPGPVATA